MNRFSLLLLSLLLCGAANAQPDPNAVGMGANPPEARPVQEVPAQLAPDTPENGARFFFQALTGDDELKMSLAVAGARVGFFGSDEWEKARRDVYAFGLRHLRSSLIDLVTVEARTEDEATVSLVVRTAVVGDKGQIVRRGAPERYTLQLRRDPAGTFPGFGGVANVWRVVPPSVEEVLARPFDETPPLQLAAVLALHDPRLLPRVQQQLGLSQLKQLGLGAFQFALDSVERFALDDAGHERALRPYLKVDSLYTIAGTKDEHWHFNDNLSAQPLAALNEPARTVLFYDGSSPDSEHLNFRFNGKTLICFADAHCQARSKEEVADLIWKP